MKNILIQNGQDDKEVFVKYYDFIKVKSTRKENIKELVKAGDSIKNEVSRREHNLMVNLVIDFCELNNVINFSYVEWDNIKRAIKLYRYVDKHYGEERVQEYKNILSEIWEKDMSSYRYNNILAEMLRTLKKSYTISTKAVSPMTASSMIDEIWQAIEMLSVEDKKIIMTRLINKI